MQGPYEHMHDHERFPSCWRCENNTCLPHFHRSIEIVYVTEGEFSATLNGQNFTIHKNQILISPSYTVHYYKTAIYSESFTLMMPMDFITYQYKNILQYKTFANYIYSEKDEEQEVLYGLKMLAKHQIKCKNSGSAFFSNISQGYISVILAVLIEQIGLVDIRGEQHRYLIRDILIYLQDHFAGPLTLENLATQFGYSKSRFSHIFNEYFGCTLTEYINSLRCRHAATLLLEGNSLIEAAMNSGFESMRTFYRCFKHVFRMTPSTYINDFFNKNPVLSIGCVKKNP